MMGYKIKKLKTYTSFSLEDLVPEDNFYRQVEQCIDLSFVRDLVCHLRSLQRGVDFRNLLDLHSIKYKNSVPYG